MAPEPFSLSLQPHLYGTVDETDKIKGSTSEQIRLLRKTKRSMTAQADADGPVGMLPGKAMHCQQQQQ